MPEVLSRKDTLRKKIELELANVRVYFECAHVVIYGEVANEAFPLGSRGFNPTVASQLITLDYPVFTFSGYVPLRDYIKGEAYNIVFTFSFFNPDHGSFEVLAAYTQYLDITQKRDGIAYTHIGENVNPFFHSIPAEEMLFILAAHINGQYGNTDQTRSA